MTRYVRSLEFGRILSPQELEALLIAAARETNSKMRSLSYPHSGEAHAYSRLRQLGTDASGTMSRGSLTISLSAEGSAADNGDGVENYFSTVKIITREDRAVRDYAGEVQRAIRKELGKRKTEAA